MKATSIKYLALALSAGSLAVTFGRPSPDADMPPEVPEAVVVAAPEGWHDVVVLRLQAKGSIARDVADGRRSLWEAAALYRELNRLSPEPAKPTWVDPFLTIPTDTAEGWLCRQVVQHVRVELHRESDRAGAAVERLEAEFFGELRTRGAVRLPGPESVVPVGYVLEQAREALAQSVRRSGNGDRESSENVTW